MTKLYKSKYNLKYNLREGRTNSMQISYISLFNNLELQRVHSTDLEEKNNANFMENYALVLSLLITWVKDHHEYVDIQYLESGCIKILIKKEIGEFNILMLSKMFQDLTLEKLDFIDVKITNEWIAYIYV